MNYKLLRSKRKTLSIEVIKHGEVLVRAPKRMSEKQIEGFLEEKADWIEKHRQKVLAREEAENAAPGLSEAELKELIKKAKEVMPKKTAYFAELMGVTYGKITIRKQHTRWGSCTSAGNLNYNALLMLTPEEIQDYVTVHELAHRKQMNHSAKFWAEVEKVLPDYREREKWLKENGGQLMARLKPEEAAEKKFYAYILQCADGSFYIGYTPNLKHRLKVHNSGTGAKYTRVRRPVRLVYFEEFDEKEDAFRREANLKQLTRREKEALIRQMPMEKLREYSLE